MLFESVTQVGPPHGIERRRRSRPFTGAKPVDLMYLRRFTMGNIGLEREVLGLFIEHAPKYLEALRAAETDKGWHDAAHTLKGAARGVGAWRVARTAEDAERIEAIVDPDRRAFAVDNAAEAVEEAIGYIQVLFRTWTAGS